MDGESQQRIGTRGVKRLHPTIATSLDGFGIRGDLHIIGTPQVKNFKKFGSKRLVALQREALENDCTVERKGSRSYIFTSCDTGPGGVHCLTLDEVDEELDNWRY